MKRTTRPSTGRQVGVGAALLLLDLLVIACLLYGYGITGWADGYDSSNPPDAPRIAQQAMWLLAGGAVVTGGGLLARGWPLPGTIQLLFLGGGAGLFAFLAAR